MSTTVALCEYSHSEVSKRVGIASHRVPYNNRVKADNSLVFP